MSSASRTAFAAIALLIANESSAIEWPSRDAVELHGFGSWAAGVTNARSYLTGTRVGRLDNLEFALLVNAHPDDQFSAEAQVYGATAQRTRLDWGFATWRFSRSLSMRVGQVKYPAGLSGEVRDVGVKRPFLHVQVAGLVDFSRTRLLTSPAPGSPSAMHHLDLALGVNAWVTRDLVVKMAIHDVSGGRFVTAPMWSDTARTTLYELGAQFAF